MHYYMDDKLWSIFSETVDRWSLKNRGKKVVEKYDFKQVSNIVAELSVSVDKDAEEGQFSAHFFVVFLRHLRLKKIIEGKDVEPEFHAIEELWKSIGNRYNFKLSPDVIQKLLDIGKQIRPSRSLPRDDNVEKLAASAIRLSKISSGITISKASIKFDEDFSNHIFRYLDDKMAQLGGLEFVSHYNGYIKMIQLYYSPFDRYIVCRQEYLGERQEPINFLLNLAARHFDKHPGRKWEYQTELHEDIINVATDFLEVCDLQGKSGFAYAMMDPREVAYHLCDELFFYKMCIPCQYSSRFILSSLKYLFHDWFDKARRKYSYCDYYTIAKFFLNVNWWEKEKRFLSLEEIYQSTRIARYKLKEIFEDISLPINRINKDFNAFDSPANFWDYPLFFAPGRGYCCFDRILCGRGFLARIYQIIKPNMRDLDSEQGHALERWLYDEMKKKGYTVKFGKYPSLGGLEESDCDFVLENNRIHLLELKKQQVMREFNNVDDVSLYGAIGKGMIRAQKQCFAHELYLRKNKRIVFPDDRVIEMSPTNLPASKISICYGEYSYVSSKAFMILIMKSILKNGEIKAIDENRQKELNAYNKYSKQILDIIIKQNSLLGRKMEINEIIPYSLFCSIQQILMAIWNTSNENEFLEIIEEWSFRIDASLDLYIGLFEKLNRKENSVSQAMIDFVRKQKTPPLVIS